MPLPLNKQACGVFSLHGNREIMVSARETTPLNAAWTHPALTNSSPPGEEEYVFEESLTSTHGRSILAFGITVISVIFGLFIILTAWPHAAGQAGSSSFPPDGPPQPPSLRPKDPVDPASIPTVDTAVVGSPTRPHARLQASGCPPLAAPPPGHRFLQIKNNCNESLWLGVIPAGAAVPPGNSWLWEAGECKTLTVVSSLASLRVWGRTHCDADFNCLTGSCRVDAYGGCTTAGETPCTLWEATLQDHCTPEPVAGMVREGGGREGGRGGEEGGREGS